MHQGRLSASAGHGCALAVLILAVMHQFITGETLISYRARVRDLRDVTDMIGFESSAECFLG